jgi:hypothetical protein
VKCSAAGCTRWKAIWDNTDLTSRASVLGLVREPRNCFRKVESRGPVHDDGNGRCGITRSKKESLAIVRHPVLIDNGIDADRSLEEAGRSTRVKDRTVVV